MISAPFLRDSVVILLQLQGTANFQGHTSVTEKQMELQMFASLTAGSTGLLQWMIGDGDYHAGWKWPRGRHWEQSRRLNRKVAALSPTLMSLQSRELLRVHATDAPDLTVHPDRNHSRASLLLTGIAETIGCSGQTSGGANNSDTATTFGCWTGYVYKSCEGMQLAAKQAVQQNPCTLDGNTCSVPIGGGTSFCIDHYPAEQCRALCDANGGVGGASGMTDTAGSCTAYATSTANESCCLFTATVVNNATLGRMVLDNASTLHLQVSANRSADPWECPGKDLPQFMDGSEPGYTAPDDLKSLSVGGEFVVGEFIHADGRPAVMVQNFDHTLSAMPTLVIPTATTDPSAEPSKVQLYEVSQWAPEGGKPAGLEVAVEDELPTVPGLQISLDAAEARLFIVGAPSQA